MHLCVLSLTFTARVQNPPTHIHTRTQTNTHLHTHFYKTFSEHDPRVSCVPIYIFSRLSLAGKASLSESVVSLAPHGSFLLPSKAVVAKVFTLYALAHFLYKRDYFLTMSQNVDIKFPIM